DGVQDTGCPLKVLHTDCAKQIPFFTGMHRFLPALVLLQQGRVKQIPVRHFPRTAGKSKYHLRNRLVSPFIDCFAYRWMKKRYINYHIADNNLSE
ncbi:MAG: dolichol-phosphate mannosyltransferase, partial [Bacteroides reticulotermitis]